MMSEATLLKQGAEARVFVQPYLGRRAVVKERFQKTYRHPDLDVALTKERIKNEARAIVRCKTAGVRTPALYLVDFTRRSIYMEYFDNSITVKDFIINRMKKQESDDRKLSFSVLAKKIGTVVRKMHENNIIHGDLTTSNMLLVHHNINITELSNSDADVSKDIDESVQIVMIDFGLAHTDSSSEDKGVDLYVLERALISTHNDVPELFEQLMTSYKRYSNKVIAKEIIDKFEEVRARGRKRTMIG